MIFLVVWCALLLGVRRALGQALRRPRPPGFDRMRADLEQAEARPDKAKES